MPADPTRIATARQLLTELGVSIADLQHDLHQRSAMPTMAEYLPRVAAAAGPGAQRSDPVRHDRQLPPGMLVERAPSGFVDRAET